MALGDAPVAVVGAGIAGLTAARELNRRSVPVVVYEAGKQIAGLARSFRDEEGFTFDFGAHFITNRFAAALGIGAQCRTVRYFGETVLLRGRTYSYPFGLLRSPRFLVSAGKQKLTSGDSAALDSAADWYRRQYGPALAEEVAIPLVEAWSGADAADLASSVIPPQLDRGILNVLKLKLASRLSGRAVANGFSREQPEGVHVFHVYPTGGVSVIGERLAEGLDGRIRLESRVEAIHVESGRVVGVRAGGQEQEVSAVVSTAPVHILARLVQGTDLLNHLARFRYRPMVLVNLRFDMRPLLPDVCTWIPERSFPFFRLTEAPLSMPWLAPPGKTMVTVDIGCEVGDSIWNMQQEDLGQLCVEYLDFLFPGARNRYLGCRALRTPVAYPVYLREYERERIELGRGLPIEGLLSVGRNGEFAHILMEDVYWRTLARIRGLLEEAHGRTP